MKKKPSKPSGGEPDAPPAFSDAFAGPFNDAFAELRTRAAALAEASPESPPSQAVKRRPAPARAVVRLERKGHGGKEVTVVEQLELSPQELASWLKLLKSALGCGGSLEAGTMILQGDQRERIQAWLAGRGVKKVSVG
jgi:translation initiation factor 1